MILLVLVIVAVVLGYIAWGLARSKGRNTFAWTFATVLLGLPLLILIFLPAKAVAKQT